MNPSEVIVLECKYCGQPIHAIYPNKPSEGFIHTMPGNKPHTMFCKGKGTYAEPK